MAWIAPDDEDDNNNDDFVASIVDRADLTDEQNQVRREAIKNLQDWNFSDLVNENDDYANRLIKEYHLKTLDDTDEIYSYTPQKGIFQCSTEPMLRKRIDDDLGQPYRDENGELQEPTLTTYQVNEYLNRIRRRTSIKRDQLNPSIEWLACKNCMINLLTGEPKEFSSTFLCTTQIPVTYNPEYFTTSPATDFFRLVEGRRGKIVKFLYEVVSDEDVEIILDFMAYCLWREYRFNFWMLFNGAGFNGKSILLTLIERFLGKQNVSGETLDRLLHRDFSVGNLFGKMVNVDADVSADVIFNNTGIIKKLTGNDVHTGEFKHKNPFKFVNYAKLIFSCNIIPDTEDKTDAFIRRILIINFTQQFFGDKEDPYLVDKLCTEEEFSILLQYELLPRLRRIMERGYLKKVTNEALEQTHDKYARGSDPVKYFFEKALEASPGNKVPKIELTEHFDKFCKYFGFAPESDQSVSRKLTEEYHLQYKRTREKGVSFYYWKDIALKNWQEAEVKEEEENRLEWFAKFSNAAKMSDEELK